MYFHQCYYLKVLHTTKKKINSIEGEYKISKLLWSEYTSTWNWTVSCMAPRCTGMWGALATSPPSGPNIAHEKSRRSCVQLNEKTHNWPWPFKMSVENTITDCVFINRWKTYVRMKSLNYLLFQNNYNIKVSIIIMIITLKHQHVMKNYQHMMINLVSS